MLASLSLIVMLMFAAVAVAQEDNGGQPATVGAGDEVNVVDTPVTAGEFGGGQTCKCQRKC